MYTNGQGSNTLGIVYPNKSAKKLSSFLSENAKVGKANPIDLEVTDWRKSNKIPQYVVVPCLLEHTGLYSSSKMKQRLRSQYTDGELFYKIMKHASKFVNYNINDLKKEIIELRNK